jgi:hypothetical protein
MNDFAFRRTQVRADTAATYRAARSVALPILMSIFAAAGTIALLSGLEYWLDPGWAVNDSAYVVLLETLAGVSGVFLALYFTAVSTVAATAYADVPSEARDLLVRDKLGNSYVRVVAFLAAVSVGLLAIRAPNHSAVTLAVPVVLAAAAVAIFAFVELGRRAFQFFDPVALANLALGDLGRAVNRVITYGPARLVVTGLPLSHELGDAETGTERRCGGFRAGSRDDPRGLIKTGPKSWLY